MDLQEAINIRISRRKYVDTPISNEKMNRLNMMINELAEESGLHIEFVENGSGSFGNFLKSYGLFTNVRSYIAFMGRKEHRETLEQIGYYGEKLVLEATRMGLGTCWVGGTYDKEKCPCKLNEGEKIICLITVGNVPDDLSIKEKFFRNAMHRKIKPIEKMYTAKGEVPEWFLKGMKAVQKAPSAVNKQPVVFHYEDGKVSTSVKGNHGYEDIDLGIAKLHFELGSGLKI